ncbi:HD domain-containing 3, isoform CRA_c [Syncephalis fuscata]|nr:HD domain-containing 3, isoform CRA_c [Syncephalis fuscata]
MNSTLTIAAALLKANDFAAHKHRNQIRKDGKTPYINHPIGVAHYLAEAGIDDLVTLQAALLHDTVEDTDTTFEEVEEIFGPEVRLVVEECSDDMQLPREERRRIQVETLPHKSVKARQVKLADKLYNLRDLLRMAPIGWTPERVHDYFVWSRDVVDVCRGVCEPLEKQLDEIFSQVLDKA